METTTKPAIEIAAYPEMPPVATLLSKARAYLSEPEHWLKNDGRDGKGRFCAVGAIANVIGWEEAIGSSLYREAADLLGRSAHGIDGCAAVVFNDSPSTTHTDILALFDRAIAAALAAGR